MRACGGTAAVDCGRAAAVHNRKQTCSTCICSTYVHPWWPAYHRGLRMHALLVLAPIIAACAQQLCAGLHPSCAAFRPRARSLSHCSCACVPPSACCCGCSCRASAEKFADQDCLGSRVIGPDGKPGPYKFIKYKEAFELAAQVRSNAMPCKLAAAADESHTAMHAS
jgi:hypothetical protein